MFGEEFSTFSLLTFTAPNEGTYLIEVAAYSDLSDGPYLLSVFTSP